MTAIDLFAGLGGFTQGALQAGVRVVFAANHSPTAVEYHRRNHPEVSHACQEAWLSRHLGHEEVALAMGWDL